MAFETTICQECPTPIQWPSLRAAYLRCINIALDTRDAMLKDRYARISELESQLKAMTAERDAQAEAVRVWRKAAEAGYNLSLYAAASREDNTPEYVAGIMEECQATQDAYDEATRHPIAVAAVKGGGG